jgi:hypothetical protein
MFLLAWLAVLIPAAIALWCFAAYVLNGTRPVRLLVATMVPAAAVACLFFVQYWTTRTPPPEPGWDIFYAIVSMVSGAATLIVTLPVVFIAEARFGRSPR